MVFKSEKRALPLSSFFITKFYMMEFNFNRKKKSETNIRFKWKINRKDSLLTKMVKYLISILR